MIKSKIETNMEFDQDMLEQMLQAAAANPGLFQKFLAGNDDDNDDDVEEESEEEIQKNPSKRILWAAENNHIDVVKDLLQQDKLLVSSTDSDLYTPLHRACYNGHVDMVRLLLSFGANIEVETVDGWHPIHSAARWNQVKVISTLLQNGANINAQTKSGQTALHLAAAQKDTKETLTLLLQSPGVDVNVRNSVGDTAEDICTRTSKLCKLFVERRERLSKQEKSTATGEEETVTPEGKVEDTVCSNNTCTASGLDKISEEGEDV